MFAVDRMMLFDILSALALANGRDSRLFGSDIDVVRQAFAASLTGTAFPELWFEIPLIGEAWTDFHSLVSYADVVGTDARYVGHEGVYADALAWFASQQPGKVRQLALSYDTSAGIVDTPAVQLLLNGYDMSVPLGFLKAVGRPDADESYVTFVRSMPKPWYACYVGVFPQRKDDFVRVECILDHDSQVAYAQDPDAIARDLSLVGITTVDKSALDVIGRMAATPFPLELQFNVGPDGRALPVVSASLRFAPQDWTSPERAARIGALGAWLVSCGLADDRLSMLPGAVIGKRLSRGDECLRLMCYPVFFKVRWKANDALMAKVYTVATAEEVRDGANLA